MSFEWFDKELSRVINRAIANCSNFGVVSHDTDLLLLKNKVAHLHTSAFSDLSNYYYSITKASCFCDRLEEYAHSLDVDVKENIILTEDNYREILGGINFFRSLIHPDNIPISKTIEHNAKRHLPEFKNILLLEEYNQQALRIHDMKRGYTRLKRKNQQPSKDYERSASSFFEDVLNDDNLKEIKPCHEKLMLYINCLKIVDCLPSDKYGRLSKFQLKKKFNLAIKVTANILENTLPAQSSLYHDLSLKAAYEENKYHNAIVKLKQYTNSQQKTPKLRSIDIRNKKAFDEWYYK